MTGKNTYTMQLTKTIEIQAESTPRAIYELIETIERDFVDFRDSDFGVSIQEIRDEMGHLIEEVDMRSGFYHFADNED